MFDEVENDIRDKEQFIVTQNERIKTMHEVLNELIEYQVVLDKANKVIHGKLMPPLDNESIHTDNESFHGAN